MSQTKNIQQLLKRYQRYQLLRQQLKVIAEQVRANAKLATSLLRRDDYKQASALIKKCESFLKQGQKMINRAGGLANEGFWREAMEEYVEAKVYYSFLRLEPLKFLEGVEIGVEEALGGVCDFTGELVRKAISLNSGDKLKQTYHYKSLVEKIVLALSKISFSGKLRSKYDQVERNLKRLEEILYERSQ